MRINRPDLIEKIPQKAKEDLRLIAEKLQTSGFENYVIGGGVRDLLIGKTPKEFDITTSATPSDVKKIFKKVIETGIKHGTVTIILKGDSYEITTFRKDIDYIDGRRPENIEFGVSLSEDLNRRDFTMNAIALNVFTGELIDEHFGLSDIEQKIIRTIGDPVQRFSEDGLRPVRAIRFISTISFSIEKNTYDAIYKTRHITKKVSTERFHDELNKILRSEIPFDGLKELFLNEIYSLFLNDPIQYPDLSLLKKINELELEPISLRLFFLSEFFGDSKKTEERLRKLKYSNEVIKEVLFFIQLKKYPLPNFQDKKEIRKLLSIVKKFSQPQKLHQYLNAYYSLCKLSHPSCDIDKLKEQINFILQRNDPLLITDLAINGNTIQDDFPDIEKKEIGKILQLCLESVLENPENNHRDTLKKLIESIDSIH